MTSRKKNKGKERKAKKAELEAERIEKERAAVRSLWVDYARGVDEDGRVISQCNHGCDLMIPDDKNHPVTNFIDGMLYAVNNSSNLHVVKYFRDTFTTHQEVWDNERYRKMAANIFIATGTNFMINNKMGCGYLLAVAIVALENYDGEGIISTLNNPVVSSKVRDLAGTSTSKRRDLLKFYRKKTTCSCLKRMHLEARKTQPKMGICYHCHELKERALLMVCSRCGVDQYCTRECQVAHWPEHKSYCEDCVRVHEQQQAKKK